MEILLKRSSICCASNKTAFVSSPLFPRKTLAVIVGWMVAGPMAYAQVGPDVGALQQQLQREVDRERATSPSETMIKKPLVPSIPKSGSQAIDVSKFTITGMTLITQDQAQESLKPFMGQKLTLDQIKDAGAAVTHLYSQMGRVAQAVIPPQDVQNGVIQIKIIEGKVGDVVVELDKVAPSRLNENVIQKFITARNARGDLIDLNGLEHSLALLNEMPGNEVNGELSPGSVEEASNIQVHAKDTGFFAGRVDASNYGAASTGIAQLTGSLSLNNPSGNGDQATLDVIGSQGSVFGQFKYAMPIGYDGWRVAGGVSVLDYSSLSNFSSTATQGTAQTYGIYATYALERTAKSNKTIVINFENKNYDNLTNDIETSNYQINNLSAGINGNNFYDQAYLTWGATVTLGHLSINNASQLMNDQNGPQTSGYFGKLALNASVTQPLPINRTNIMGAIYGQLANTNLNSAEQFYLGGPYGVRAYPVAQGGGAQGLIASVEVMHTYQNQLQVGLFADAGLVQQYINTYANWQGQTNAANTYALFSAGPMVKYNYEKVQLSAALAFRLGDNPLYNQSGQQLNTDNQYQSVQGWVKCTVFF